MNDQNGSGTTLAAAAHGITQRVIPLDADQHANAAEVAAAGCGFQLDPKASTGPAITDHVEQLLSSHESVATGKLAAEIVAIPSPAEAMTGLTHLVSQR